MLAKLAHELEEEFLEASRGQVSQDAAIRFPVFVQIAAGVIEVGIAVLVLFARRLGNEMLAAMPATQDALEQHLMPVALADLRLGTVRERHPGGENLVRRFPKLVIDKRLMPPRVFSLIMHDHAAIQGIANHPRNILPHPTLAARFHGRAVLAVCSALFGADAVLVEKPGHLDGGRARRDLAEDFAHDGGLSFVRLKQLGFLGVAVTEWRIPAVPKSPLAALSDFVGNPLFC